jgi:hypothetical protein
MKISSICVLAFILALTGCAVGKYTAAEPSYTGTSVPRGEATVVVFLEPVFPGKPFSETVCDNTVGVMWSPEESQQIGFTQRYANTLAKNGPQLAMLATLPANLRIGMSASGGLQPFNVDSRIMVPYGRFITSNLEHLMKDVGAKGTVCQDRSCVDRAMQGEPGSQLVTVRFTKLSVAEKQRNILALEVEAKAAVTRPDGTTRDIPINSVMNRSIASEGLWHSDFLKAMNKIANENSSDVAAQIYAAAR